MKTETLINALRILALDIQSDDGVACSVVARASYEIADLVKQRNELLEILESVMDEWRCGNEPNINDCGVYEKALAVIAKAKGEK